jgi:hypothetical protein
LQQLRKPLAGLDSRIELKKKKKQKRTKLVTHLWSAARLSCLVLDVGGVRVGLGNANRVALVYLKLRITRFYIQDPG